MSSFSLVGVTDCGPQQRHRFCGLSTLDLPGLFASLVILILAACFGDKSKELGSMRSANVVVSCSAEGFHVFNRRLLTRD